MNYSSIAEIVQELEDDPIERSGHVYHAIPFPEFAHLKTSTNEEAVRRKVELVTRLIERRRDLGLPYERVLDIGANAGLFTFTLCRQVSSVTAYEPHPRYGPIGEFLAGSLVTNVDWRPRPFTVDEIRESWDVALMLSTFQWIAGGDGRLAEGKALLLALSNSVPCLIFELGMNAGASAVATRQTNHINAIYRLLQASTEYRHIKLARRTRIWRNGRWWKGWRYTFVCSHDKGYLPEVWYAPLKHVRL